MSIQKTKSKNKGFRYRAWVRDHSGNLMRTRSWDRKIDAEREERELLAMRDKGVGASALAPLPFNEAVEAWVRDYERRGLFRQVLRVKQFISAHFLPHFGQTDIKRIKPSDIAELVCKLKERDLAPESINSILRSLKTLFNYHIEEDNLSANPVKKKHKVQVMEKQNIVWTVEEVEKFLAHSKNKYWGNPNKQWVYLIYKLAASTGMRINEVFALDKSDIDFELGRIRVSKSRCIVTHVIKTPKNGKTRYAPLASKLSDEIKQYIVEHHVFGPLFLDKNGEYRSYNTFRNCHFLKDIQEVVLRRTKFHNLRRFFITQYVQNGGTEVQLRKIVGHGTQGMTDHYTVQPSDMNKMAQIVNL